MKKIAIFLIIVSLVACEKQVDDEFYIVYRHSEECKNGLDRLKRNTSHLGGEIKFHIIDPVRLDIEGYDHSTLVKVSVFAQIDHDLTPSINRYLYDCGPNSKISGVGQEFVHSLKGQLELDVYRYSGGEILLQIDGDTVSVYYSSELKLP